MFHVNFSLTLNKLKQKRLLEEKIAQRKAQQLEELQQKQNAELAVSLLQAVYFSMNNNISLKPDVM